MKLATFQGEGFQIFGAEIAKELDIDFIPAPKTTERLLQESDRYTPDNWCLDVKLFYGACVEAIKKGANVLILPHYALPYINLGPCLLPWAVEEHFPLELKKQFPGKDFQCFAVSWWNRLWLIWNIAKAIKKAGYSKGGVFGKVRRAAKLAWEKVKRLDQLKELFFLVGASNYQKTNRIYHAAVEQIRNADNKNKIEEIYRWGWRGLSGYKKEATKLPKIGLSGDFFALIIDKYPFFDIEETLIRDLGVSVYQPFTSYKIFDKHEHKDKLKPQRKKYKKYIRYWLGGADYHNIPFTLKMKDEGVDGIIHMSVFACHPESITRNVLHLIAEKEGLPPMLELTFDTHTQPEAVKVRLEAFVDMLRSRKS